MATFNGHNLLCHPNDASPRVFEGSIKMSRKDVLNFIEAYERTEFNADIAEMFISSICGITVFSSIVKIAAKKALSNVLKDAVEEETTKLLAGITIGTSNLLISNYFYKNTHAISNAAKNAVINKSGKDFTISYKLAYHRHGSNEGAYLVEKFTVN